ncbi:MAG TPA: DUF3455 domain-containing protein [Steroidobacteraceae bacterium]|nr:DUF3455 domain-containing protein [Steroidobacteraceae bacterium]
MKERSAVLASGLLAVLVASPAGAGTGHVGTKTVPDELKAPAGQVLAISARAVGVQIYECAAAKDDPTQFLWTLKAPEAELRYRSGKPLGKHYAGPTWEAGDGSKVVGELVAKRDAPDGTAIPWLLLRAKSTSGTGVFTAVASIQRLRTVGGKAPASGCDRTQAGREARVSYSAEYLFYAAGP